MTSIAVMNLGIIVMFNRSSVMVRSVGKPPSQGKSPAQLTVVERVSGQADRKRRAGFYIPTT